MEKSKTFIEAVLEGFEVPKRTYTVEFKDWNHKNMAKAVIVKHGGKITNCFQCYCYYCVEYTATEEQDAEICAGLVSLGLLDEGEV